MEKAERILLDKKRLETAKVASREEQAEVIAQELFHKPGSLLSEKELAHIYQESRCEELRPEVDCKMIPFYHSIRTIPAVCNNLEHPTQGASFTPFGRLTQAQYANGVSSLFNQAIFDDLQPSINPFGAPFPSARLVSDTTVGDRQINDTFLTHLIMQFGQFMDHDLDLAVEMLGQECDLVTCEQTDFCAPVRVAADDEEFGEDTVLKGKCHPFVRTVPACDENPFQISPREQVNELTHYIDASNIYGSTDSRAEFLRELTGGRLRVSEGNNLPIQPPCSPEEGPTGEVETPTDCCPEGFDNGCFVAGDVRALEHVSLTVIHTLFVREHNRVAAALSEVNPQWLDDRLYEETRNIIIAEIQHITFNEYLPALFGQVNFNNLIGDYLGYNPEVDVSIPNSFATAIFRFGHSQIQEFFERLDENYESVDAGPLSLRDSFFSPDEFDNGGGVDPMVRGWLHQPARAVDEFLNTVLTSQLFEPDDAPGEGMDLATLNIQRGRDHGLPRYGTWRRFCRDTLGLQSDLRNELTEIRLMQLYGNLENADLFVGALAEEPFGFGALGAVSMCVFAFTFNQLREGDRFWFENPDPELEIFTSEQLVEIKRASFSRIICDNTAITQIQDLAFFLDTDLFFTVNCDDLPAIDFTPWEERDFCFYRATINTAAAVNTMAFNRERNTGNSDITAFPLPVNEAGSVSRCIPFICPSGNVEREIFIGVEGTRRRACTVLVNGARRQFLTESDITTDPALFSDETVCMDSTLVYATVNCDGLETTTTSKIASRSELESELARALKHTVHAKTQTTPLKYLHIPTALEHFNPKTSDLNFGGIFNDDSSTVS